MSCESCVTGMLVLFVIAIIGSIITVVASSISRKEKEKAEALKRSAEQEQRWQQQQIVQQNQNAKNRFEKWKQYYDDAFLEIEKKVVSFDDSFGDGVIVKGFDKLYQRIEEKNKERVYQLDINIQAAYKERKRIHIEYLHDLIGDVLTEGGSQYLLFFANNAIHCLKYIDENDGQYMEKAEEKFLPFLLGSMDRVYVANFTSYGEASNDFLSEEFMETIGHNADERMEQLRNLGNKFKDGSLKNISENFEIGFFVYACRLMWYYAAKKPFQVDKFEAATDLFNKYTISEFENYSYCKVDALLARIYSKKLLGGENVANQEIDYINQWLEAFFVLSGKQDRYKEDNNTEVYTLASGLAWMELDKIELAVLRKLVEHSVTLPEDIQARLGFLESGGKADIRLYSDIPENIFGYDSSVLDWGKNEFDFFFRKIATKKFVPDYSLALERWTKTLPLTKGQKIVHEDLYKAFCELTEDFDGEIICSNVYSKAVNLENVANENATLFKFTSERNRCVAMLFSCEKYGRNLNIEILTLFTPEKGKDFEQLEKYCAAIKGNVYVESFRESILQVVDDIISVKEQIYSDEVKSSKVFE